MTYGISYQGGKSRIAEAIVGALPAADVLVDLFGGGGAVTHCAALSGKWKNRSTPQGARRKTIICGRKNYGRRRLHEGACRHDIS